MYKRPDQPREESAGMDLAALQHRKVLAHHCQIALVEIPERRGRSLSGDAVLNQSCCVTSLLDRHLCHAGQRLAVLLQGGDVAYREDFGMSRDAEVRLNAHA